MGAAGVSTYSKSDEESDIDLDMLQGPNGSPMARVINNVRKQAENPNNFGCCRHPRLERAKKSGLALATFQ